MKEKRELPPLFLMYANIAIFQKEAFPQTTIFLLPSVTTGGKKCLSILDVWWGKFIKVVNYCKKCDLSLQAENCGT